MMDSHISFKKKLSLIVTGKQQKTKTSIYWYDEDHKKQSKFLRMVRRISQMGEVKGTKTVRAPTDSFWYMNALYADRVNDSSH